jgi:hypothetical protein
MPIEKQGIITEMQKCGTTSHTVAVSTSSDFQEILPFFNG